MLASLLLLSASASLWGSVSFAGSVPGGETTVARPVAEGNVRAAVAALRARFRLDTPQGLAALREFSLGVLRGGLQNEDPYERCYAASALAEQGDWSGAGVLETGVASSDPGLRRAAIEGLGEVGQGEALRMLRRIYAESDSFGQLLVLQGLRSGGSAEALDLLIEAVRHADASLRLQAVENLGLLGDARAIPAVRGALAREDVRMFERVTAAHALLRLGDRSGVSLLLAALEGAPGAGRAAATLALGYAKEERLVAVLEKLLGDSELDVAIAAAAALSRYGKRDGLPRLRQALEDEDGFTRRHVAMLLEHVEYGVAREVVLAGLEAGDVGVRLAAAHTIGVAGDAKDIGALTKRIAADEDPLVRADVAWALGHMSSHEVIEPLIELVQEEAPTVRYTAADALARTAGRLIGPGKEARWKGEIAAASARHQWKAARRNVS
ncbi:MAG: HEAT repeat domain-containing protein [Deltaproteobacteria bacterium]|nr:HEAT repeat domain-containing protein [Deltaproteobacteria bacterium]